MKKLILVDGHSLAYRAFYGLPLYDRHGKPTFTTAKGEFTNAVYGFANMLLKVWNDEKPDGIAVAFDLGRTFRDDLYEPYKGTREKMPDELVPQIGRIVQLVESFGIPAVSAEGYEADDVLGTLATRAAADGIDTLIVTGDSDAFQLIGPLVRVLTPGRTFTDTSIYDEAQVQTRYGLTPQQLIDFKALKGDTSDNIPGVKGIGEKTATDLLQRYGDVENVYAHLDEVTPPRAKTALEAGQDIALLSKDLVTIRTAVPLELDWDACAVQHYDRASVEALFDELEFLSIRNRLPKIDGSGADAAAAPAPAASARRGRSGSQQMSMFGDEAVASAPTVPNNPPDTVATLVRDAEALAELVAALSAAPIIAFDTETTGTDALTAELVGLSFAVTPGAAWYLPVGHVGEGAEGQLSWATVRAALEPLLADAARPKVAHNAKYDIEALRHAGVTVNGLSFDTMLAEFLVDPGARLGLKALAKLRLGFDMTEIATLIGKGKSQITMADVAVDEAGSYAAADADMTLRLMQLQAPAIAEQNLGPLFHDIEVPLVPVLVAMELNGVAVDMPYLEALAKRLGERLVALEDEIYQAVGTPFNINSPVQLADVLFGQLGLSAPGGRKTSTGKASVAADVLDSMKGQHPVIDLVLEHRQLSKIKGTYLDALPRLVNPTTHRVHTTFSQVSAVSGRLASQDPNLQNIPIRTELGREVRRGFVAAPGNVLISADYSQVELRICAHISGDPGLRAAFEAGEDIHRATAAKVLGLATESVTADQRSFAKRINFGLLYGMGAQSLAQQAGISMKEAQQFVDAYFATFPKVRQYIDETKRKAREEGFVETLLGRRRYFPILATTTRDARTNIMQRTAEREAVNHPLQGTAADIIKIAMLRIHAALIERDQGEMLTLQVHDELVLDTPAAIAEETAALVRELMESAYPLDPPLKVDVGLGPNWDAVK
jgi:DNA polymerase-1